MTSIAGFPAFLSTNGLHSNACLIHLFEPGEMRHMPTDGVREHILNKAGEVFAEKGYERATVREICRAANVNCSSVNYYFGDKQQLYVKAVALAQQTTSTRIPLPHWSADTPAQQRLTEFIRTLLTRMIGSEQAPWHMRLMTREVLRPTDACNELVEVHFRPHLEILLSTLADLMPAGTSAATLRKSAFSIVGQCLFYRVAGDIAKMLTPPEESNAEESNAEESNAEETNPTAKVSALTNHIAAFSLAALAGYAPDSDESETNEKAGSS